MIMRVRSRAGPDVIFKVISSHLIRPATCASRQLLSVKGQRTDTHRSRVHDFVIRQGSMIVLHLLLSVYFIYIYILYIFENEFFVGISIFCTYILQIFCWNDKFFFQPNGNAWKISY